MNSLMTEVIEDHIRLHVVDPSQGRRAGARCRGADRGRAGLPEVSTMSMTDLYSATHNTHFPRRGPREERAAHMAGDLAVRLHDDCGNYRGAAVWLNRTRCRWPSHEYACRPNSCLRRSPIPMPASMPKTSRFTFGTGKFGDLAGFTSAIILAMIALLIGYESVSRLFTPVAIHFAEAIPIAGLGSGCELGSAWLLSSGGHHHGHGHGHPHEGHEHGEVHCISDRCRGRRP